MGSLPNVPGRDSAVPSLCVFSPCLVLRNPADRERHETDSDSPEAVMLQDLQPTRYVGPTAPSPQVRQIRTQKPA